MAIIDEKPVSVFNVPERTRGDYAFTLRDRGGEAVPASALTTATLKLYLTAPAGAPVITVNGRNNQNILNMNDVTIGVDGRVVWDIQSNDMMIIDGASFFEPRIGVFEFIWPEGHVLHEVVFNVRNVPQA